jgi:peptidoglycan/xylan/chitin deacetylase (PgdA/CDA1 family)
VIRWFGAALAILALPAAAASGLVAVTYHDVTPVRSADPYALTTETFTGQMQYLRDRGYTPVSLALLERVRRGEVAMPERAVLLTFDDGLKSFESQALPVLERYGYPVVLSVVGVWADGRNIPTEYRGKVMDWNELRRVAHSPRVEIISHTDNLHHGVRVNREGNEAPAVIARAYVENGLIEREEKFRARIREDLLHAQRRFTAELGRPVLGIAWPFGEYDEVTQEEARRQGMLWQLDLDARPNRVEDLPRVSRSVLRDYRGLADIAEVIELRGLRTEQVRVVAVDLGAFGGKPEAVQERRLSEMLERVRLLRANAVIVTPFTADGGYAFFGNPSMPVADDVLGRVLYQLRTRAGIRKYAMVRIPVLRGVSDWPGLITGLSRNVPFSGVIFDDPAAMRDPAVMRVLHYYHPGARVGVRDDGVGGAELRVVELDVATDSDAVANLVQRHAGDAVPPWFLVRRPPGTGDDRLRAALRALRRAGARHYGYSGDDYVAGLPDPAKIVSEFSGRSVVNGAP